MSTHTKYCPRCAEHLPVDRFYANKGNPDGLSSLCITHHNLDVQQRGHRRRKQFIESMGGVCEGWEGKGCPWHVSDYRCLQVDHVRGDGAIERAKRGNTTTAIFYAKVLANRSEYALLCANCNQIKKFEQKETVGRRIYTRAIPTERKEGPGQGYNPSRDAKNRARFTSEYQSRAAKAKKGIPNPKVAEARRGTKLVDGHWVRPKEE